MRKYYRYYRRPPVDHLTQGDIVDKCPIPLFARSDGAKTAASDPQISASPFQVIVLSQACDLEPRDGKIRLKSVVVAPILGVSRSEPPFDNASRYSDLKSYRLVRAYHLPACEDILPESWIDLANIHSVPLEILQELVKAGNRRIGLQTPLREHLGWVFGSTYARFGKAEDSDIGELDPGIP